MNHQLEIVGTGHAAETSVVLVEGGGPVTGWTPGRSRLECRGQMVSYWIYDEATPGQWAEVHGRMYLISYNQRVSRKAVWVTVPRRNLPPAVRDAFSELRPDLKAWLT